MFTQVSMLISWSSLWDIGSQFRNRRWVRCLRRIFHRYERSDFILHKGLAKRSYTMGDLWAICRQSGGSSRRVLVRIWPGMFGSCRANFGYKFIQKIWTNPIRPPVLYVFECKYGVSRPENLISGVIFCGECELEVQNDEKGSRVDKIQ